MLLRILSFLLALGLAIPVLADTTYTYTGNHFTFAQRAYTTSDFVHGSLTLPFSLPANFQGSVTPLSYSFTDGVNTFTNMNLSTISSSFSTDAAGDIDGWNVSIFYDENGAIYLKTTTAGDQGSLFFAGFASNTDGGTWTSSAVAPTPEPGTLLLVGTALLAFTGAVHRRTA